MNSGAFGENFPYTNFHDLNLDWIIKEIKENRKTISDFSESLAQMGLSIEEFQQTLDEFDDTIQEKIDTEVPIAIREEIQDGGFNQLLSDSHKRRIVFIGDSYGQGWTPDGTFTPWPDLVKSSLGLDNNDYYNSSAGGAGFGKASNEGNQYVPYLIQQAYNNISNPETVTDVVMAMGYNDYLFYDNPGRLSSGIQTAVSQCKQLFPTAMVHVYAIGFCTNPETQVKLRATYRAYGQTTANMQYYNISKVLSTSAYLSSDGIHPLQTGQYAIAISVLRLLNNGTPQLTIPETMGSTEIKFMLNVGNDNQEFDGLLYAFSFDDSFNLANTAFKIVTLQNSKTFNLSGNTATKLAKIIRLGSQTGWYTPNPLKWSPCKFFCSTTGNTSFITYDAEIAIAQDASNNDYNPYLWIRINGTSGGGFQNITNIYRFGIMGFNQKESFVTES